MRLWRLAQRQGSSTAYFGYGCEYRRLFTRASCADSRLGSCSFQERLIGSRGELRDKVARPLTSLGHTGESVALIDAVFETERLVVRRWRDSELLNLMAVYGDEDAMKWVGVGQPIAKAECEEWLLVTNRNFPKRGYGMFAMELRSAPYGAQTAVVGQL